MHSCQAYFTVAQEIRKELKSAMSAVPGGGGRGFSPKKQKFRSWRGRRFTGRFFLANWSYALVLGKNQRKPYDLQVKEKPRETRESIPR